MKTVKVSTKYQVVIPKAVREAAGILSGQEVAVLSYGGRIELIPLRPVGEMRGFLRGLEAIIEREKDREV